MKINIIAAVSQNGILGVDNKIPWHYPADLKRFRKLTLGSTVIMGRKTFESIGKPLPGRKNVVVSSTMQDYEGVEIYYSLIEAINACASDNKMWIIGGGQLYSEAIRYADEIDLTIVPEFIQEEDVEGGKITGIVKFPWINPIVFNSQNIHPGENGLLHLTYRKT